jgi:hypothetical protein
MDKSMARVQSEIVASTGELRRLAGWPDLSPIHELASLAVERWLVSQVSAAILNIQREESAGERTPGEPGRHE